MWNSEMFSKRFLWNLRNDVFAEEATKNYERQGLSVVIVIVRMGQDLLRPSQLF